MLLAECYFSAAGEIDNKGHVITVSYEVKRTGKLYCTHVFHQLNCTELKTSNHKRKPLAITLQTIDRPSANNHSMSRHGKSTAKAEIVYSTLVHFNSDM